MYYQGCIDPPKVGRGRTCDSNTAGILAGIRPCGVIVLLAELFTSESKSQVYAILHEFMRKHVCASDSLGKCNS